MHSLEAGLAPADVLVENISSSGWSDDVAQPIVLTGVRTAGSWEKGEGKIVIKVWDLTKLFFSKKFPLHCTRLCQVAGVSTEAISTNADERIVSYPCQTGSSIMAEIHLAVVTWGKTSSSLQELLPLQFTYLTHFFGFSPLSVVQVQHMLF